MCVFSGSSGEEVMLSERRLQEDDVENPQAALPENLHGSQEVSAGGGGSDGEQEQDEVSQQDEPHVHWCDQLERSDQDRKVEQRKNQNRENKQTELRQIHSAEKKNVLRDEKERKELDAGELQMAVQEQRDSPEERSLEEATAKMNECSSSEKVVSNTSTSAAATGPEPSSGSSSAGLCITQVGVSRRGAHRLRELLGSHAGQPKVDSVQQNLLEGLRRTLKEWCTEDTLQFLYGDDHSPVSSSVQVKEEEEELDEDDLDDDGTVAGELKRPSAAAPDYELLRRRTEQLELRVREFYKGTWVLDGSKVSGGGRTNMAAL